MGIRQNKNLRVLPLLALLISFFFQLEIGFALFFLPATFIVIVSFKAFRKLTLKHLGIG